MAAEANRGARLVATTAMVVAAILGYYYWTETNISRDLFERLQKMHSDLVTANQTIRDQLVATEMQKEQLRKADEEKKTVEEEKKKLDEEKKGFDAKLKEATDNAQKLANEKKAVEDKIVQSQTDCSKSCQERLQKAEDDCKRSSTPPPAKGFLW